MVYRQPVPAFQVDLNFDFIATDLLDGDQGGSTEAAASTNTQLCNSGGSSPFRRWSSLI